MTLLLLGLHTSSLSINFSGPLGLPTRVVTRSHRMAFACIMSGNFVFG